MSCCGSIWRGLRRKEEKVCRVQWRQNTGEFAYLMVLYFLMAMALSFPSVSIQFQLVERYKLGPSTIGMVSGVLSVPWVVKPGLAMVRMAFFPVCCVVSAMVYACMLIPMSLVPLLVSLLISKVCVVFIDVSIDGLMVETVSAKGSRGGLQSLVFIARALGSMVGGMLGAYVYHDVHDRLAFACSSVCLLLILMVYIVGQPNVVGDLRLEMCKCGVSESLSVRELFSDGVGLLRAHYRFITLVMLLCVQPSMREACVYFMQTKMGVSDVDFGFLGACAGFSSILSALSYALCGKRFPYRSMVGFGVACSSTATLVFTVYVTYFGDSKRVVNMVFFALSDLFDSFVDNFSMMPIMVVASIISETDVAGGHRFRYAILTSLMNVCSTMSTEMGALISHEEFGDGQSISIGPLTQALLGVEAWCALPILCIVFCMPTRLSLAEEEEKADEMDESDESDDIETAVI